MIIEGDISVEQGDDEEEATVLEIITLHGKQITESIKSAVAYAVDASRHANDSLFDLQSQNENLNRIKTALNESHNTVTVTQKIVDSYVNSLRWIKSSIPWQKATELVTADFTNDPVAEVEDPDAPSYWQSIIKRIGITQEQEKVTPDDPVGGKILCMGLHVPSAAIDEFSNNATQNLDILINELRTNRQRTHLIAATVQKQNDELEKIGDSALALQQRVAQVNRVIQDKS
ncbi:hypothetical protein BgAZ_501270 [Babesia gibsoni]|uniref:Uncharacterized protein n=1 Tax=Babesia gibsoni TaxID=33632 RepID=A0AAD8P7N7_BABGI|nr:hypothetical protein BgAZ_501270 [Babesia gibsoni]